MKKTILLILFLFTFSFAFAQQQKHEISLSYGYPTAMKYNDTEAEAFLGALFGIDLNRKFSGSINLEYMYNFNNKMAAGLILGFENSKMKGTSYKVNYLTFMPAFKMNWVEKNIFRFYSKVAAGVTLGFSSVDDAKETDTEFAYQISPLGFEVGKTISGFAEIGYGHQGIGVIGIRYRF